MRYKMQPEDILKKLGIYSPKDIDLIAYSLGAEIKRENLSGYEGQIVGTNQKAIITININSSPQRQLFSAGHECGHWVNDRGKNLNYQCSVADMKQRFIKKNDFKQNREVCANQFSADLIMPAFMFVPCIMEMEPHTTSINYLANEFSTSRTSTAIRLVELNKLPCMLVCWDKNGRRRWFTQNKIVPDIIFPHKHIALLESAFVDSDGSEVDAEKWISNKNSEDYSIIESVFSNGYDFLTLIWWKNESQLTDES